MAKKQELPTGVVNETYYEKYRKERDFLDDKENIMHETSDVNTTLNLMAGMYFINKAIAHLPADEQHDIREKAKVIHSHKGKMTQFKKRAFGATNENKGLILSSKEAELIELFGRFHNVTEVHQVVTSEWGFDVHIQTVDNFRLKNLDRIKERQEEYKREFSDLRLGYKRSRLDELTYLYNTRKIKYKATQSREDYRLLLQTLDAIKKEVEGDRIVIDGNMDISVDLTVNEHIQNEILSQLVITDIIIARVAAKTGVDARFLMAKLRASQYAKFTGFQRPDKSINEDEILYPSKLIYNFDEIERKHRNGTVEDAIVIEEPEEKKRKVQVGRSVKDLIREKIAQKKHTIEQTISNIDDQLRKNEENADSDEKIDLRKKRYKKKK